MAAEGFQSARRKPTSAASQPVSRVASLRRMRARVRSDDTAEVDLSPLIDCVFLLLIFFLVTTMLKKLEKQIPVVLPDYTATLASVAEAPIVIYALDSEGQLFRGESSERSMKGLTYREIDSFSADLKRIAEARGTGVEIRIDTDRGTPVQKVIDALDTLSLQGFENVGVRLRHRENEYFELSR